MTRMPSAGHENNAAVNGSAVAFCEVAERYIALALASIWCSDYERSQCLSRMWTHAYPVIGHLPVGKIDTALIMKVLGPIWTARPALAPLLRFYIEKVLDWATVMGLRQGANPARWMDASTGCCRGDRWPRRARYS
jgi:hypothetical protein